MSDAFIKATSFFWNLEDWQADALFAATCLLLGAMMIVAVCIVERKRRASQR
jgi:hypothetical protein